VFVAGIRWPLGRSQQIGPADSGERSLLGHPEERARFEEVVLPHIDAAYNLARWLLGGNEEAQDLAQEAMLRAYHFFRGFRGGNPRAWLLKIVRSIPTPGPGRQWRVSATCW
jgi:hypothetical protein